MGARGCGAGSTRVGEFILAIVASDIESWAKRRDPTPSSRQVVRLVIARGRL